MNAPSPGGHAWRALDSLGWDEAADAFNRCYEGYVIPVRQNGRDLAQRCLMEDVDPTASYVIEDRSGPVAIGLVARRDHRSRLAAFAVVPRVRGTGIARPALARLLEESRKRGDRTMELEVFEHNLPAVRLYSGFGFEPAGRLVGFEQETVPSPSVSPSLPQFPAARLAECLAAERGLDVPWQLRPETISWIGEPWQVVGDGDGALALVDLSRDAAVGLRLIYTPPALRRTGRARGLLDRIRALASGRPVQVPQLIPENWAGFARALGFDVAEHGQLRMVRALAGT